MNEGTKSVNVRDYYNNGYEKGFQKGELEERERILNMLLLSFPDLKTREDRVLFVKWKEQLQKEINSQTESGLRISDKEVAQPYSKSDKTTKEIWEEKGK